MTDKTPTPDIDNAGDWAEADRLAAEFDQMNAPIPAEPVEPAEPADTAPENDTAEMAELLSQALFMSTSVLAPNWEITQGETDKLGSVYASLINKYFPDVGVEKFGLEIAAVITTGMVVAPRIGKPRKKEEKTVNEKADTVPTTNPVEGGNDGQD